jgi:hypothetical protein
MQLLAILLALVSIGLSFFSAIWPWVPVTILALWMLLVLFSAKNSLVAVEVAELSPSANQVLRRFRQYYRHPWGCRELAAAARIMQVTVVVLGGIGWSRGTPWSLAATAGSFFIFGPLVSEFYPIPLLLRYKKAEHDEILEWLNKAGPSST